MNLTTVRALKSVKFDGNGALSGDFQSSAIGVSSITGANSWPIATKLSRGVAARNPLRVLKVSYLSPLDFERKGRKKATASFYNISQHVYPFHSTESNEIYRARGVLPGRGLGES